MTVIAGAMVLHTIHIEARTARGFMSVQYWTPARFEDETPRQVSRRQRIEIRKRKENCRLC